MTFRIPSQGRVSQPNSSDVQGTLYATRNIDLDEEGYIKLASATVSVFGEVDDAEFDNVHSMFHGSNIYFVGNDLFRENQVSIGSSFSNVTTGSDTTPPSPGAEEDGVFFNGTEVVSDGSSVKYNNAGTWTSISGTQSPAAGEPSCMAVFPSQNSLLFATGNKVNRINTSWTVSQTLTIPADYLVTSMDVNGAYAYIATRHKENGEAVLFLWLGSTTTNDGAFGVGTYGIQSIRKYQSSVAMMDSLGRLLQFTGSGFAELAALPVYFTRTNWGDANNDYGNIYNRGMVVDGDLIYLNIANETEDTNRRFLSNQIGNIWCFDPEVGLYQRYSYTNTEFTTESVITSDINVSTDIITSGTTVPSTGALVFVEAGTTNVEGLIGGRYYYIIKVSDSSFKLAETYQKAIEGDNIDLVSITGAVGINLFFLSQKDYGQGIEANSGASIVLNNTEYNTVELNRSGYTAEVYSPTMVGSWRYMQTCQPIRNLGYFVTPKMLASETEDQFISAVLRFKQLDYGDKITVKYKDKDRARFPVMPNSSNRTDNYVTWTSSTTFTTVSAPADNFYDLTTVEVGDEVEIIGGAGSGVISHIASITKSGFQYTITLEEANPFVEVNDKSLIKIDNWTVLETIDGATFTDSEYTFAADRNSGFIQYKIVMEGVGVAIYDNIFQTRPYKRRR